MATVLLVLDSGEVGYEAPDSVCTDAGLTQLATERTEEGFTESEAPVGSNATAWRVHEFGHPTGTVVGHVVTGSHGREGVSWLLLESSRIK